jgi:hypothetical protein
LAALLLNNPSRYLYENQGMRHEAEKSDRSQASRPEGDRRKTRTRGKGEWMEQTRGSGGAQRRSKAADPGEVKRDRKQTRKETKAMENRELLMLFIAFVARVPS